MFSTNTSFWQLSTADMKKITEIFMCILKFICVPNFISLGWFLFSSTVISFWQLVWKKITGIFMCKLKFIFVPNFISLGWFSFSSNVLSCWQLLKTDDSCYEKNLTNFHVHTKVDTFAKFHLSRLIFIFQLLSAVINCYRLLTANNSW